MKLEFFEGDHGTNIILRPENVIEAAQLMRAARNSKVEMPDMHFDFSGDSPSFNMWIKKKTPQAQSTWIKPNQKK